MDLGVRNRNKWMEDGSIRNGKTEVRNELSYT